MDRAHFEKLQARHREAVHERNLRRDILQDTDEYRAMMAAWVDMVLTGRAVMEARAKLSPAVRRRIEIRSAAARSNAHTDGDLAMEKAGDK